MKKTLGLGPEIGTKKEAFSPLKISRDFRRDNLSPYFIDKTQSILKIDDIIVQKMFRQYPGICKKDTLWNAIYWDGCFLRVALENAPDEKSFPMDILPSVMDEFIKRAVKQKKVAYVKNLLNKWREVDVPLPPIRFSASNVFSKAETERLLCLLCATLPDCKEAYREAIRKDIEVIFTPTYQSKAENAYCEAIADVRGYIITEMIKRQRQNGIRDVKLSFDKQQDMVFDEFKDVIISSLPDKSASEMALTGSYFLMQKNESWARFGFYDNILSPYCEQPDNLVKTKIKIGEYKIKDYCVPQEAENTPRYVETAESLAPVTSLFLQPDEHRQLLSSFGFANYMQANDKRLLKIWGDLATIFFSMSDIPDTQKGALSMVYILSNLGLLSPLEEFQYKDTEDAVDIKAQKLQNKNRKLALRLAQAEEQLEYRKATINKMAVEQEEAERMLKSRDAEIGKLQVEKKQIQENADALLDALNAVSEEEEQKIEYEFPASLNGKKVVNFGGHPVFRQKLQELLPELVVYVPERKPDGQVITGADAVFIQTNCLSHPNFYYIINLCRRWNVPVYIYPFTGAKKCAAEILNRLREGGAFS